MFKTIVWATDGSETADAALVPAKALAAHGSRLIAVHSKDVFVGGRSTGLPVHADERELEAKIERQVAELRAEGVDAFVEVVHGQTSNAAKVIADAATELEADVIVAGTRGHGPITGAIVGSVTQQLLHLAPCPVLVVPPVKGSANARSEQEHAVTAG